MDLKVFVSKDKSLGQSFADLAQKLKEVDTIEDVQTSYSDMGLSLSFVGDFSATVDNLIIESSLTPIYDEKSSDQVSAYSGTEIFHYNVS